MTAPQRVQIVKNVEFLRDHFACSWRNLSEGRAYTLLTGGILHGGVAHLLCNAWGFWSFGAAMCNTRAIGPLATMGIFAGGILMGNGLSLYAEKKQRGGELRRGPSVDHVGMSGGTLAMLTTVATMFPTARFTVFPIPKSIPARAYVPVFALFTILADAGQVFQGIDHMGHLGGMGLGVAAGLLLKRRMKLAVRPRS